MQNKMINILGNRISSMYSQVKQAWKTNLIELTKFNFEITLMMWKQAFTRIMQPYLTYRKLGYYNHKGNLFRLSLYILK